MEIDNIDQAIQEQNEGVDIDPVYEDKLRGIPDKVPLKRFVIIWERLANSGIIYVQAENPKYAFAQAGFNSDYVKHTIIEIKGDPYIVGHKG
tara:strand:- start:271 stop:546 length:276 start_codon:yes stop_codon:yes gene_type:complete